MDIFKRITNCYLHKLPFVVYRKPNEDCLKGIFQKDDKLHLTKNYTETGFVFAPFDNEKQAVIIPVQESEVVEQKIDIRLDFNKSNVCYSINNVQKKNHIKLVEKAIDKIERSVLKKVILSRREIVKLKDFNLVSTFKKLIKTYPSAMSYLWYHPAIGLWLGATPELLLKVDSDKVKAISLAGTQIYAEGSDIFWGEKEIKEQQLVSDYIVDKLSKFCTNVELSDRQTVKAGNLLHLKTEIYGSLKKKIIDFKRLLEQIHPTPAVCGLPKEESKKFILENEDYKRAFYTGFLGELNFEKADINRQKSELFVNLRCMEIKNNQAFIFVGGGITEQSNPEKEWEETVAKSQVMKKVLINSI